MKLPNKITVIFNLFSPFFLRMTMTIATDPGDIYQMAQRVDHREEQEILWQAPGLGSQIKWHTPHRTPPSHPLPVSPPTIPPPNVQKRGYNAVTEIFFWKFLDFFRKSWMTFNEGFRQKKFLEIFPEILGITFVVKNYYVFTKRFKFRNSCVTFHGVGKTRHYNYISFHITFRVIKSINTKQGGISKCGSSAF